MFSQVSQFGPILYDFRPPGFASITMPFSGFLCDIFGRMHRLGWSGTTMCTTHRGSTRVRDGTSKAADWRMAPARARPGRLSALSRLSVSHSKAVLCGAFVWARRALNRPKRRFPARAGREDFFTGTENWKWHEARPSQSLPSLPCAFFVSGAHFFRVWQRP